MNKPWAALTSRKCVLCGSLRLQRRLPLKLPHSFDQIIKSLWLTDGCGRNVFCVCVCVCAQSSPGLRSTSCRITTAAPFERPRCCCHDATVLGNSATPLLCVLHHCYWWLCDPSSTCGIEGAFVCLCPRSLCAENKTKCNCGFFCFVFLSAHISVFHQCHGIFSGEKKNKQKKTKCILSFSSLRCVFVCLYWFSQYLWAPCLILCSASHCVCVCFGYLNTCVYLRPHLFETVCLLCAYNPLQSASVCIWQCVHARVCVCVWSSIPWAASYNVSGGDGGNLKALRCPNQN